jgi:hypothetical protein
VATEQGGGRLNRSGLLRFEQIKLADTFFVRSGLLTSEPLLEVGFRFGNLEFVNACHVCCLNPTATLYHL